MKKIYAFLIIIIFLLMNTYTIQTNLLIKKINAYKGPVRALALYRNKIFSGGDDGYIKVWNATTGNLMKAWKAHSHWIFDIAIGIKDIKTYGKKRALLVSKKLYQAAGTIK